MDSKIEHLDRGADDYLAKPFKTAELVARIKALLRRPKGVDLTKIKYGDLVFDETQMTLNDEQMTIKESEILTVLIQNPEKLISKEHLLAKIWGEDSMGDDNYIETYVSRIRKMLKKLGSACQIKTVRGLGYKLTDK